MKVTRIPLRLLSLLERVFFSSGYWVRQMRQSPQAPPFFGTPSKTADTVLDLLQMFVQRTILSEDLFFFREHLDLGRKICKPRSDLLFFSDDINFWKFLPQAPKLEYPPLVFFTWFLLYSILVLKGGFWVSFTEKIAYSDFLKRPGLFTKDMYLFCNSKSLLLQSCWKV